MTRLRRLRYPLIAVGLAAAVVAFLAFRPDKLFVDDVVDESLEEAFVATPGASGSDTTTSTSTAPTSVPEDPSTTTTAPVSAPEAVTTGGFTGIDHSATGTATVYEQDGRHVLRLEDDTDIQNGPDLYVWVLASDGYAGGDPEDYIDLGKIKGNVGGQNYELPEGFDPDTHRAVLIWCLRFRVPFAVAPLG